MSTNTPAPSTAPGQPAINQAVLGRIVEAGGVAAVSSRRGTGRVFLDHFIHRHPAMAGRDHVWLGFNSAPDIAPTSKAVALRLATALGQDCTRRANEHALVQTLISALKDRLANRPLVICIDGVEHLCADGLRTLRYVHDRIGAGRHDRPPRMALLFVTDSVSGSAATGLLSLSNGVSWVVTY
jgi:hypothetical protein